jgi:glycosyltransferase involved in cell wall biosynthesis
MHTPRADTADDRIAMVVPCYNEADRLDTQRIAAFVRRFPAVSILFVNDGSTDRTASVLEELCRDTPRCSVLALSSNAGKGEAVRLGMLDAFSRGFPKVAYWDADLAIPPEVVLDFARLLSERERFLAVIGSRVQLMGRVITRRPSRHYLGRVFATAASLVTGMPVYDTQCGAKLFRADDAVRQIFATPFLSRWIFDVEILARLARNTGTSGSDVPVYECPLEFWRDVPGSKVGWKAYPRAAFELLELWQQYSWVQNPAPRSEPAATVISRDKGLLDT